MGLLREAAKQFDAEPILTPRQPWSYENRGEACLDQGQPDQAIKFYREALARNPQLPKSLAGLGKTYVKKGEITQGIRSLEEAISLADRVCVLTAGPATVKNIYPIDLPRPRKVEDIRFDPRFVQLYQEIWEDLREEVLISYERNKQHVS